MTAWEPDPDLAEAISTLYAGSYSEMRRSFDQERKQQAAQLASRGLGGRVEIEALSLYVARFATHLEGFAAKALQALKAIGEPLGDGSGAWLENLIQQHAHAGITALPKLYSNPRRPPIDFASFEDEIRAGAGRAAHAIRLDVRIQKARAGRVPPEPTGTPQVVYAVTGDNPRINVNSVDASTNVVHQAPSEIFEALREAIRSQVLQETAKTQLLERMAELERDVGTPGFAKRYAAFVAAAADHMSVLAPFMPALTQLLLQASG